MKIFPEQVLLATHALLRPETAVAAAELLDGVADRSAIEGLVELIYHPPSARSAIAAINALKRCQEPIVLDALTAALKSPHVTVRVIALQEWQQRQARPTDTLSRLLGRDESWLVRRAVLRVLAEAPDESRWLIFQAATDPHWRVRHALIQVLLDWGQTEEQRGEIDRRLEQLASQTRVQGVRSYLHYRWSGNQSYPVPSLPVPEPSRVCPFWDWDAAVLLRTLERLGELGRREAIQVMPFLVGQADERVRGLVLETLRRRGQAQHLAEVVALLDEPRLGGNEAVLKLFSQLDLDRIEEVARLILHLPAALPAQLAWALDQVGQAVEPEDEQETLAKLLLMAEAQPVPVRCALARLVSRWKADQAERFLLNCLEDPHADVQFEALQGLNQLPGKELKKETIDQLLNSPHAALRAEAVKAIVNRKGDQDSIEKISNDPDATVRVCLAECLVNGNEVRDSAVLARLQTDPHPHVRAAALTPVRAAEVMRDPTQEISWHVRARAARLAKTPLWNLEPEKPWRPQEDSPVAPEPLQVNRPTPPNARLFGPEKLIISPLGISGHYGLPVEGFVRAIEAGINLLFWEPNYQTMTDFVTRLSSTDRHSLHFLAGTFEADGPRVQRDVERVLRNLKLERLTIFLIFWVQSWNRISPDVLETLENLKAAGKIGTYGLSTHSRSLAVEAMEEGWDPVMVRHSAAHRGAEEHVFPRALELGTSIITFNNTCYGRLLKGQGGLPRPNVADCYRYTLVQPAVRVCFTAPATLEHLEENLPALYDLELTSERRRELQAQGDWVYQEDTIFRKLVRAL